MAQTLKVFQSAWALRTTRSPSDVDFGTLPELARRVAAAGYAGIDVLSHPAHPKYRDAWLRAAFDAGLDASLMVAPTATEQVVHAVEGARAHGTRVKFVNLLPKLPVDDFDACACTLRQWIALGERAGVPVFVETHRRTVTNDIWFTLRLLEAVPELRLVADLSHVVVSQEADLPMTEVETGWFPRLLDRTEAFQGRVATSQQVQVPVLHPQYREWVDFFTDQWRAGFRSWRRRHRPEAELVFICELGPPFSRYAMTDAGGNELSDRWEDAMAIKRIVQGLWRENRPRG